MNMCTTCIYVNAETEKKRVRKGKAIGRERQQSLTMYLSLF